jgi:hypothetical protein
MKKLAIFLVLALTVFSCTLEDQCGYVTDSGIDNNGDYTVYVDGDKYIVAPYTWYSVEIGDWFCLSYYQ